MKADKNVCIHCREWLADLPNTIQLSDAEFALLNRPQRTLSFAIPVRMDNGLVRVFNAHRVQYNDALGPTKGGIRYHHEVDIDEVKTLAFLMSLKCSLAGIPYGGGKGGIEVDPSELSEGELERLTRAYVRAFHRFIGPRTDIPAPDVNTNAQTMAWFVDEYSRITGHFEPGVVTGKPIELGGSLGRDEATGLGGAYVLDAYRQDKQPFDAAQGGSAEPKDWKVAIQGFGNVGGHIAHLLHEWGYKVVAVSDATGGRYDANGLNVPALCKGKGCKLKDDPQGAFIENKDLLELDVDVLIPAALSDQITSANAQNIKAHTILEMANAPVAKSADDVLFKKGVTIIPDILANSGGVVVSYFEWVQNSSNEYWKKDRVYDSLKEIIVGAYERVRDRAAKESHSLRVAAYEEAIDRILAAEKLRGHL